MTEKTTYSFRTTEPAAAVEHLRSSYGRLGLEGTSFEYEVSTAGDHRFSVGTVLLGGELVAGGSCDGFTIATGPNRYRWEVYDERGDVESAPVLFHPGVPLHVEADHARVDVVRFDTDELERFARLAFDNPKLRLDFDGSQPVSPARGARWAPLVHSILSHREELANDLIRASAYRQLAAAALGTFRFEHASSRRTVTSRGAAIVYRTASAFIEENAHRPITVEDVASAVGATSRQLTRIFMHHSSPQERPEERIRRVRLAAAHRELTRPTPDHPTLGEVAARWGFTQAGLVRHYRRAYGADPRVSLRS